MTRISKKTAVAVTLAEAQKAATLFATTSAKKDVLESKLNEALAAVREKFEPQITELTTNLKEPSEVLHAYALEQRKEWDGKSIELSGCVIGFRTNPPSVGKKRGITWPAIVALFKGNRVLKEFVKVKEDIDKAAILKAQNDAKIVKHLTAVGIEIEQEEQFYVDTKKEKLQE